MSEPTLEVAEIFSSLQGEGPLMGQPAAFLRLAGCVPPFCPWCDTPHALGRGRVMSLAAVERELGGHAPRLVVITGGEPFRQWATGLAELTRRLARMGRALQYETSAKAGIPEDHGGIVVCSPKPAREPRLAAGLVDRVDAFKFVVENDLEPVLRFVATHHIDPTRVWLMPLGATRDEQLRRMADVWEACARHGFNLSPRLHILTFDDKKGV